MRITKPWFEGIYGITKRSFKSSNPSMQLNSPSNSPAHVNTTIQMESDLFFDWLNLGTVPRNSWRALTHRIRTPVKSSITLGEDIESFISLGNDVSIPVRLKCTNVDARNACSLHFELRGAETPISRSRKNTTLELGQKRETNVDNCEVQLKDEPSYPKEAVLHTDSISLSCRKC